MSLNKTLIDWGKNPDGTPGYTWNPLTGCLNHTDGMCKGGNFPCYAYRLAQGRLKNLYLSGGIFPLSPSLHERYPNCTFDPFYPRFWKGRLLDGRDELCGGKPKGIFVCDMSDLFGIGIPEDWTRQVLAGMESRPQHRFYLLTKRPENLQRFSPFPSNVWLGVSATNQHQFDEAVKYLKEVKATVKFISFEPLLERIKVDL